VVHPVTPNKNYNKYNHGLGVGDVNGDKRLDLLEKDGWWEHPASRAGDPVWTWHPFTFGPADPGVPVGGAQMFAYDVNGDGLNDVIWGKGHGYGLYWMEQGKPGADGKRVWTQHVIDDTWSQVHPLTLADLSGDGIPDIITGKRFRAHNDGDPGGGEPKPVGKGDPRESCGSSSPHRARCTPRSSLRDTSGPSTAGRSWAAPPSSTSWSTSRPSCAAGASSWTTGQTRPTSASTP
jgi:hypothetical protein